MPNANLRQAKRNKNDEFYTQYADIEKEINAYIEYDPDVFRGKTILCPCDDPLWSNFTKYFAQNFTAFGIRKVICTSYAGSLHEESELEKAAEQYDAEMSKTHGKIFILEEDLTRDGIASFEDFRWTYLEGDGDFRSEEVTALRDEADFIITNPPFSLFREFLAWIMEGEKKFAIIGNVNAVTYKETFPLIKENEMWMGCSIHSGDRMFNVPNSYPLEAAGCGVDVNGMKFIRVKGVRWFTNIDHGRRHTPLVLMTMEENLRHSKHKEITADGYLKYDNYDAIEVPYTDAIPSDYEGEMGVPITFLDKYCPEQFRIIGGFNASSLEQKELFSYVLSTDTPYIEKSTGEEKIWNGPTVNKQTKYYRIIIKKIT